ncbi:MAG: aldo/keto reductase [Myxococcales bacterium]|nr:aldo/keto reductase [Myxococcales bacterium]
MAAIHVQGVTVPEFMYGTAWKQRDTARCVLDAIRVGFRAIDTANQRKHYFEQGVGDGLARALDQGVERGALFLQTKFTYRRGQDHRLPYDPRADTATQVAQSFASSLEHLGTTYLDSLVLHGPERSRGLTVDDWRVWRAMEQLQERGAVRLLGVSNVALDQLAALCQHARRPPAFVQNRCYARARWDGEIRALCRARGVVYQGFSLLTANPEVPRHPDFSAICSRRRRTPAQVVFRFAQQLGMLPLTGTTDPEHMREDLHGLDFELDPEELARIETLAV